MPHANAALDSKIDSAALNLFFETVGQGLATAARARRLTNAKSSIYTNHQGSRTRFFIFEIAHSFSYRAAATSAAKLKTSSNLANAKNPMIKSPDNATVIKLPRFFVIWCRSRRSVIPSYKSVIPTIMTTTNGTMLIASYNTSPTQLEQGRYMSPLIAVPDHRIPQRSQFQSNLLTLRPSDWDQQVDQPVNFDCRLKPKAGFLTTFNGFSSCLRQLANNPIRFQRVIEPLFRPAFLDTACHGPLTDFLPKSIEKRKFPTWLIHAAFKPLSLPFCGAFETGVVFVCCSHLRLRFHS